MMIKPRFNPGHFSGRRIPLLVRNDGALNRKLHEIVSHA